MIYSSKIKYTYANNNERMGGRGRGEGGERNCLANAKITQLPC